MQISSSYVVGFSSNCSHSILLPFNFSMSLLLELSGILSVPIQITPSKSGAVTKFEYDISDPTGNGGPKYQVGLELRVIGGEQIEI